MREENENKPLSVVGIAKADITPDWPVRLAGFAARAKLEATEVLNTLTAKALAFGNDEQGPVIIISVEIIGIQWRVTNDILKTLSEKTGINPEQIAILVTHTHGSPEVGNLINGLQCRGNYPAEYFFSEALLARDELLHIARFNELLTKKLVEVALCALKDRKPAIVAWGQGNASFSKNRRTEGGPVDVSMPILKITALDGTLRAIFLNYACHGISLGPDINKIHGDWMGEAQRLIEEKHPGCIAMVAIGCAGDAHPVKRDKMEYPKVYGEEIFDNVEVLLSSNLIPIAAPPQVKMKWAKIPFSKVPSVAELIENMSKNDIKGYYSRLALERILRGENIPKELNYPIQVWNFDDKLTMINMGGEVVVDYAVIIKQKYANRNIWINAYANDVSCYIPSRRILKEGGYEADISMYWYNQPSPLSEVVEDIIMNAVQGMMFTESAPSPSLGLAL
jgi:hypothetical protein